MPRFFWLLLLALGLQARVDALHHCDSSNAPSASKLLEVYGQFNYSHSIRTSNDTAQKLFNLGLALTAGYNQQEARRAFRAALWIDNLCAMCWWGVANARGPFQNKFAMPSSKGGNPHDYYSEEDVEKARFAIRYAAALVGLEYYGNATRIMAAIASALLDPKGTPAAQGQGKPVMRLMERMQAYKGCPGPNTSATGAPPAAGSHRMLGHAPGHSDGPGGDDNTTSIKAAAPSLSRLDVERYYIAAMFDRLSVNVTNGPLWEKAEKRYVQDMEYVASCIINETYAQPDDRALALALAAEALANFTPWEFAEHGLGAPDDTPAANTSRILSLLNQSLSIYNKQPLALHLMIHVTEELPAKLKSSSSGLVAGEGLASANQLGGLFPTLDHLQHMPSHTFVRVGEWDKAVKSNEDALWASVHVSWNCSSPLYAAHNVEMLVFAANLGGNENKSVAYSRVLRDLARFIPDAPSIIGPQWSAPLLVYTLYGNWDLVRAEPLPDKAAAAVQKLDALKAFTDATGLLAVAPLRQNQTKLVADVFDDPNVYDKVVSEVPKDQRGSPLQLANFSTNQADAAAYALAVWLYAQTMALANATAAAKATAAASGSANGNGTDTAGVLLNATDALRRQLDTVLNSTIPRDKPGGSPVGPGPGMGVLATGYKLMAKLMSKMAAARLALLLGKPSAAVEALQEAVKLEDEGGYTEPPRLAQQPARQCLGLAQLHAKLALDAAKTFIDDLDRYPKNPWSLRGLMKAIVELEDSNINISNITAFEEVMQRALAYRMDPAFGQVRELAEKLPGICPALGPDPTVEVR